MTVCVNIECLNYIFRAVPYNMHRLRSTFKRGKTPSASDIQVPHNLEIPKQIRSTSFDEIKLIKRDASTESADFPNYDDYIDVDDKQTLQLPEQTGCQRSKSTDSAATDDSGSFLEVPRRFQKKKSPSSSSGSLYLLNNCVHCQYLDELHRSLQSSIEELYLNESSCCSEETSSSEYDDDSSTKSRRFLNPNDIPVESSIKVHLSPHILDYYNKHTLEHLPIERLPSPIRRKSICRQEAFLLEHSTSSGENVSDMGSPAPSSDGLLSEGDTTMVHGTVVRDFYLTVPDLKRDRAVSVDSSFSKNTSTHKTEQFFGSNLEVPVSSRSRSVDIVLPTPEHSRYKALALNNTLNSTSKEKAVEEVYDSINVIKYVPDWHDSVINGEHLWTPTSASGDFCYLSDNECLKQGSRLKCPACNIIAHQNCVPVIRDRLKFLCKPTFRDVGIRQYREQTSIHHHWVHRRSEQGKCKHCGKSFQSKLSFSCKEIVAISCSWCKVSYHNKESCFGAQRIEEECNLGVQKNIIVPPSWIVKLPKKGNFKSSLRDNSRKRSTAHRKKSKEKEREIRTFTIKSIPSATITPLVVFINPKSGGNQGVKLLQKFQWLLNPRQVFDLTQGGPKMGLELFRKVPNLRVLACGGDGTAGWILSVLDQINISPSPAVGVLPLGTGNDLARALGWGGGYTDEPVSKILTNISNSNIVYLDRWQLNVEKNTNSTANADGKENLPLNVINNYFSMGVDAHIALEFHEAREAHPEKFNSRLRNKMFYGQAGGKDLLKRKWKGLAEFVTIECDGKDLTPKLKEHKVHAIVFLNIQSYGGGTKPWNRTSGFADPATDDQLIEVVGLTTYQLPLLQAGGHGTCLAQCREAKIVTSKTIPMQVDGEACKVNPSIIYLKFLNKAAMLAKRKGAKKVAQPKLEDVSINVHCLSMPNYEKFHYDKDVLIGTALEIGTITINPIFDLEQIRIEINKLCENNPEFLKMTASDWCFVDSCTAERFFRIDRAQEQLHYVTDISSDNLYILDMADKSVSPSIDNVLSDLSNFDSAIELRIIDDSRLDSPSDHPPVSPKSQQSPDDDDDVDYNNDQNNENLENVQNFQSINSVNRNTGSNVKSFHDKLFGFDPELSYKNCATSKTCDSIIKAAQTGDLNVIKKLHIQGYSLVYVDLMGQTALHYASEFGHIDVVKFLLTFAPKSIIDMKDNHLKTALHRAAMNKQRTSCCLLIAAGADLEAQDVDGLTPYLLAVKSEDHELASYLQSQEQFQRLAKKSATTV